MNIDDLLHEVRTALNETAKVELDQRLAAARDRDEAIFTMMLMAWRASPTLAQKIKDWSETNLRTETETETETDWKSNDR